MRTELILSSRTRPAVVAVNGGVVFVSVHDQYCRATYRALSQQVHDCHPDRRWWTKLGRTSPPGRPIRAVQYVRLPDSTAAFLQASATRAAWLAKERRWYGTLGLPLPALRRGAQ